MRVFLLAAIAALSCSVASAAPPTVPHIPIAQFAALPLMQDPELSPDGHWIAAQHTVDGKISILLVDSDHPEGPIKSIPIGTTNIFSMRWAGSKRLLLQVRLTEKIGILPIPILRLVSVDTGTGALQLLDPRSHGILAGDVLYVDPTGTTALVASQDDLVSPPSVKQVDLATGKSTVVEGGHNSIWKWYADEHGIVRAGVAYDGARYTLWYRDIAGEPLHKLKGKLRDDQDDATVDRLIFHGGNSWVLTNERTGRFGLYAFDARSGTVQAPVFEHPEVDVDDALFDPGTGDLSGVRYQDDRARVFWIDPGMKALQDSLDKAVPGATNLPVSWSTDRQRVLVRSMSGSDPGRYFLLDRATRQMHPVIDPYPDIDPDQLAEVRSVRYQARDGLQLRAFLTLPKGRDAKSLPLILLPHGGPFYRDEWAYDPFVQFLANRGYAVLQPEFRGSTGLGKAFVAKGYGEIGKKMQDDLDDGVDWLARSGQIDPHRVCIVGFSYGGYAAMWGAIRNPDRYRCAVSWAGPSDVAAMMHYDHDQFSASRYFRSWRKQFPTDAELNAVSPVRFATSFKVPLLIGHGEEDTTVPPAQSHKMLDALQKAGANVTSVFYKDSKHDFGSSKNTADWLTHLETFLAKYNPA